MNPSLIEELLNEEESPSLDFKSAQYPFRGASDDHKSELLKDILAFANSWRRTDAYILIGVDERPVGGRKTVVGITTHLKDAELQQFVNSKTQRPISFAYEPVVFEGKQIGVIRIELQQRPFFLQKGYGKLLAETVYLRRGSSTDSAKLDEVLKMKEVVIRDRPVPKLQLQFIDAAGENTFQDEFSITSQIVQYDEKSLISPAMFTFNHLQNSNYPKEMARYTSRTSILRSVKFQLLNESSEIGQNIYLVFEIPKQEGLLVVSRNSYPAKPKKTLIEPNYRVPVPSAYSVSEKLPTMVD